MTPPSWGFDFARPPSTSLDRASTWLDRRSTVDASPGRDASDASSGRASRSAGLACCTHESAAGASGPRRRCGRRRDAAHRMRGEPRAAAADRDRRADHPDAEPDAHRLRRHGRQPVVALASRARAGPTPATPPPACRPSSPRCRRAGTRSPGSTPRRSAGRYVRHLRPDRAAPRAMVCPGHRRQRLVVRPACDRPATTRRPAHGDPVLGLRVRTVPRRASSSPRRPRAGDGYANAFQAGVVESRSTVRSVDATAALPAGGATRRAVHPRPTARSLRCARSSRSTSPASAWSASRPLEALSIQLSLVGVRRP